MNNAPAIYEQRLARLRTLAKSAQYDTIALVPGSDLAYMTGVFFHMSIDRPLVVLFGVDGESVAAIVPKLEESRLLGGAAYPIQTFSYDDVEGFIPAFQRAATALGLAGRRIGVEGMRMRMLEAELFGEFSPGAKVIAADETIRELRLRKSGDELALMKHACEISERALDQLLVELDGKLIGMSEAAIANLLTNQQTALGGEHNSFDPIVLTGANSALPHGHPGSATVARGDLLLFDFGTTVQGYPSDITRTFAVGELSDELRKVYQTVLAANLAGVEAGRPGIAAQEIDRAARKVIDAAGYGQYFTHRTGHGLGLDVHEHPNMREGNTMILEPGMCYTVEPGIYLPGVGGVRIEDNIVVTETSVESLTTYPRELRILSA